MAKGKWAGVVGVLLAVKIGLLAIFKLGPEIATIGARSGDDLTRAVAAAGGSAGDVGRLGDDMARLSGGDDLARLANSSDEIRALRSGALEAEEAAEFSATRMAWQGVNVSKDILQVFLNDPDARPSFSGGRRSSGQRLMEEMTWMAPAPIAGRRLVVVGPRGAGEVAALYPDAARSSSSGTLRSFAERYAARTKELLSRKGASAAPTGLDLFAQIAKEGPTTVILLGHGDDRGVRLSGKEAVPLPTLSKLCMKLVRRCVLLSATARSSSQEAGAALREAFDAERLAAALTRLEASIDAPPTGANPGAENGPSLQEIAGRLSRRGDDQAARIRARRIPSNGRGALAGIGLVRLEWGG